MHTQEYLKRFEKKHDYFVAIDSDGCVFDTMEIKHKLCFAPALVEVFNLQNISDQVNHDWNQINLYSRHRGINRFAGLGMILPHLQRSYGETIPELKSYLAWLEKHPHNMDSLKRAMDKDNNEVLGLCYEWSQQSSYKIAEKIAHLSPFQESRQTIEVIHSRSDCLVSSSSTQESLLKEWGENGLGQYVQLIAGQELGKKKDHLKLSSGGRYEVNKMLMIGDAPGDHRAAQEIGALFFPILAGKEEESWKELRSTGLGHFYGNTFQGLYQEDLLNDFYENLPDWIG